MDEIVFESSIEAFRDLNANLQHLSFCEPRLNAHEINQRAFLRELHGQVKVHTCRW